MLTNLYGPKMSLSLILGFQVFVEIHSLMGQFWEVCVSSVGVQTLDGWWALMVCLLFPSLHCIGATLALGLAVPYADRPLSFPSSFLVDGGHGSGSLTDELGSSCCVVTLCSAASYIMSQGECCCRFLQIWKGFHRTRHQFVDWLIGLLSSGQVIKAAHLQSQNSPNSNMPPISNGETVKKNALWPISLKTYQRMKRLGFPATFSVITR